MMVLRFWIDGCWVVGELIWERSWDGSEKMRQTGFGKVSANRVDYAVSERNALVLGSSFCDEAGRDRGAARNHWIVTIS